MELYYAIAWQGVAISISVMVMISQMGLHATPQYRLIDLSWPDTSV